MKNKIPYIFFILIYLQEGLANLPDQSLYYFFREHLHYSAGLIGMIGFITGLAWYIKPLWGFLVDYLPIKGKRTTYYLLATAVGMIASYIFIAIFGLNFWTICTVCVFINACIGMSDVCNDSAMVQYEQKYNLKGRLQSVQWISLSVGGLIVSLGGAFIAAKFAPSVAYKVAYGLCAIMPLIVLIYTLKFYKESKVKVVKKVREFSQEFKHLKNPKLLLALGFIACFQLCPSFGTSLTIQMREVLHVDKMFIGILGAPGTVLGIVGYGLYYWKCHKWDMTKLLYFMVIFSAVTNLFYLYIPTQWHIFWYNIIFGAFSGITFLTMLAYFATLVPKGSEGLIYALITSVSNLCGRGGNVLGGIIYDNAGYTVNVIVATIFILLCLFFIPYLQRGESHVNN
jgi:MFS family permease